MTYEIEKTCCFTGHRVIPIAEREFAAKKTREICVGLIERGFKNFITGGALGFDTMAAECVISLKEKYEDIRLILAIPCKEQYRGWRKADIETYEKILSLADDAEFISEEYSPECMRKRNRFMVENSSALVAYLKKMSGGTVYTVKYAVEEGKEIIFVR